jgi:LPS export ABC transporter protein LptC
MMKNNRRAASAVLIMVGLIMTTLCFVTPHATRQSPLQDKRRNLSYQADGIALKTYDKSGKLRSIIRADSITPTGLNQWRITHPQITSLNPAWRIEADTGIVDQDQTVHLEHHVHLYEMNTVKSPITLTTTRLHYDPKKKCIRTAEPVTLRKGDLQIEARGIEANLRTQTITLLAKVHVKNPTLSITADKAVCTLQHQRVSHIHFYGKQHAVQFQHLSPTHPFKARAKHIHYDPKAAEVTLVGQVHIDHSEYQFHTDQICYNLNKRTLVAQSRTPQKTEIILNQPIITLKSIQ